MKTRHKEVMIRTKDFPILLLLATKKPFAGDHAQKTLL
jgi:hypothetical protein